MAKVTVRCRAVQSKPLNRQRKLPKVTDFETAICVHRTDKG